MKNLLLILLPLISFAQLQNIDYSGMNTINISDDLYLSPTQNATILATENYMNYNYSYGKVLNSFQSSSDEQALIDYTWKSDYMYRPKYILDTEVGDALVKGNNGTYYVIKMYSQWK